jgi:diamine N-acetyltransferase
MLLIREATVADIPAIQKIAYATWPIAYGNIISEAQITYMLAMMYSAEALVAQMTTRQHHFLLAHMNEVAIGFTAYEINGDSVSSTTKLHKLYCEPTQQKSGVGAALVVAVEKAAVAANQRSLNLNVNKNNNAIGFYQRLGFSVVNEIVVDIGQGFVMDDFVMEKWL